MRMFLFGEGIVLEGVIVLRKRFAELFFYVLRHVCFVFLAIVGRFLFFGTYYLFCSEFFISDFERKVKSR